MEELLLRGIPASSGVAIGTVFRSKQECVQVTRELLSADEAPAAAAKFSEVLRQSLLDLEAVHREVAASGNQQQADILRAHLSILDDPLLEEKVTGKILSGKNAGWAVQETFVEFAKTFEKINSAYLKERATDLHEVGDMLLRAVMNVRPPSFAALPESAIIVASCLSAADVARLDFAKVSGLVLETGSTTSHTAIIARSRGIPAIVGLCGICDRVRDGDLVAIDGDLGKVYLSPADTRVGALRERAEKDRVWKTRWQQELGARCVTLDGRPISVGANVGSSDDIGQALENGADDVGLYRTEFLFLEKPQLPDVEEQFAMYRSAAERMGERPVIVRTLDVGGDKSIPGIAQEPEENPFLGVRGIRLCLENTTLFKTQLTAILKASAFGRLKIMMPMVSEVCEVLRTRALIREVAGTLAAQGVAFDADIPVGIMIEVPIAALQIRAFLPHVDFFSIGTNDLLQYMMAVDRGNPKLSPLYDACNPAFLRLIAGVIGDARAAGKPLGICGEMAGDPLFTAFLLGAGLDKFSMNAAAIPRAKYLIRRTSSSEAEALTRQVLALDSAEEVRALLRRRYDECIACAERDATGTPEREAPPACLARAH